MLCDTSPIVMGRKTFFIQQSRKKMDLERKSLASLKGMREVSVANQVILATNSTDTNNRSQTTLTSSQNAQDDFSKKFENTKQVPKEQP
ncbi:hypothetical protein ACROYT_G011990 [Oculina patagonica]